MADDIKYDETSTEVEGDWRVDHNRCVACGAPPLEAPELMGFGDKFRGAHLGAVQCYFKRQPSTPAEVERACVAAETSCCEAVRYLGNDPAIRARIPGLVGPARGDSFRRKARMSASRVLLVVVSLALLTFVAVARVLPVRWR